MGTQDPRRGLSRRGLLAFGGAAVGGALLGGLAPSAAAAPVAKVRTDPHYAFFGRHQSGVETPPALLQTWVGLDLVKASASSARAVLELVTDSAARLTQGRPALGDGEPEIAAMARDLTVTVGVGAQFLQAAGVPAPENLRDIPTFSVDRLSRRWRQTDLVLQVGASDPLVLAHALRIFERDLRTLCRTVWVQEGFGSSAPANPGGSAGRNLFGQVDGTVNPKPGTDEFNEVVWIPSGPDWVAGGTILVLRRIRMHMRTWDAVDPVDQERAIGRFRGSGAPFGRTQENDPLPLDERNPDGSWVIPLDAHVRVSHAKTPAESIFRRGYSYTRALGNGQLDMGLLFAAYMRDPATSFIPMQQRMAASDRLNEWTTPIGSATYLVLPGATKGEYLGEAMFR